MRSSILPAALLMPLVVCKWPAAFSTPASVYTQRRHFANSRRYLYVEVENNRVAGTTPNKRASSSFDDFDAPIPANPSSGTTVVTSQPNVDDECYMGKDGSATECVDFDPPRASHSTDTPHSSESELLKAAEELDVLDLDGALQLQNNVPHSVWYNRYKQYSSEMPYMDDYDFVLTDKDLIDTDPALNLLSSEIGVKEYFSKKAEERSTGGLPFEVLLERTFDTMEDIWEHLRRIPYENGISELTPEEEETRKTVVVLGRSV